MFTAGRAFRYPAPIVNMSLWITCGPTVLPAGKNFEADFTAKSAAAPESMGAAMLVPLSSRVVFPPQG